MYDGCPHCLTHTIRLQWQFFKCKMKFWLPLLKTHTHSVTSKEGWGRKVRLALPVKLNCLADNGCYTHLKTEEKKEREKQRIDYFCCCCTRVIKRNGILNDNHSASHLSVLLYKSAPDVPLTQTTYNTHRERETHINSQTVFGTLRISQLPAAIHPRWLISLSNYEGSQLLFPALFTKTQGGTKWPCRDVSTLQGFVRMSGKWPLSLPYFVIQTFSLSLSLSFPLLLTHFSLSIFSQITAENETLLVRERERERERVDSTL